MFNIENFKTQPLEEPKYALPLRITYTQNGVDKNWEAVKSHNSVAILLYHREKDAFLVVKQFRPPVYMNDKNKLMTWELCAGIIDKDKSIEEIAQDEILEECGFHVDLNKIEKISAFFTSVGITGSKQFLFYAEIDESMKVSNGGGINDEMIILEYLPVKNSLEFIYDDNFAKTAGLMFAFIWFLEYKNKKQPIIIN